MGVMDILERLVRRVPPHSREDLETEIEALRENERYNVRMGEELDALRKDVDALKAAKPAQG